MYHMPLFLSGSTIPEVYQHKLSFADLKISDFENSSVGYTCISITTKRQTINIQYVIHVLTSQLQTPFYTMSFSLIANISNRDQAKFLNVQERNFQTPNVFFNHFA